MNVIQFIAVFLFLTYYHWIYILLNLSSKYIGESYKLITNNISWIGVAVAMYFTTIYSGNNIGVFYILLFYLANTYIINLVGGTHIYFILGIMISLFQAEYWEIPIRILTLQNIGFNQFLLPENLFLYGGTIIRLLSYYWIIDIMKNLKFDYKLMSKQLIIFSLLFIPIMLYLYPMKNIYQLSDFVFRIMCSMFFISFIRHQEDLKEREREEIINNYGLN